MAFRSIKRCVGVGSAALVASAALAAPTIDGQNIPSDFGAGALLATQVYMTQFGNDTSGDQFGGGGELDQFFATNDSTYLYVGMTGNCENNGNAMALFIDADPNAGVSLLRTQNYRWTGVTIDEVAGLPRWLNGTFAGEQGLNNIRFDDGFTPDYILGWTGGSPIGSQIRTYYAVTWTELLDNGADFGYVDPNDPNTFPEPNSLPEPNDFNPGDPNAAQPAELQPQHTNTIAGVITSGDPNASGATGTLGDFLGGGGIGILGAADNSNTVGVDGGNGLIGPNDAQPDTATTGFEFAIPLSLINAGEGDEVCMWVVYSSPSGWMSNQMLPHVDPNAGPGPNDNIVVFDNIGSRDNGLTELSLNSGGFPGDQFACITLAGAPGCPQPGCIDGDGDRDLDGDCDVDSTDLSVLLGNFGTGSGATNETGDVDGDGDVDSTDLSLLLGVFGLDCN